MDHPLLTTLDAVNLAQSRLLLNRDLIPYEDSVKRIASLLSAVEVALYEEALNINKAQRS